jgi:hypothetical protein
VQEVQDLKMKYQKGLRFKGLLIIYVLFIC